MKLLKMVGQVFLILCWCMIITLGVILIQNHFSDETEDNTKIKSTEIDKPKTVVSIDKLVEKYHDEIEDYIDDLSIKTLDASTLQVSFVLKEESDPSLKIPMLKQVSGLIDSSQGKNISFKINLSVQDNTKLNISIYECRIDAFVIPDFLIDPLNQMIVSSLDGLNKVYEEMEIEELFILDNQIILVGNMPEEVQKVWAED